MWRYRNKEQKLGWETGNNLDYRLLPVISYYRFFPMAESLISQFSKRYKGLTHIPKLSLEDADPHQMKIMPTRTQTLDLLRRKGWWCLKRHLDVNQSENYAQADHIHCSLLPYNAFKTPFPNHLYKCQ